MMPLLLVPGMMCDARLFTPQIAALHERAVMVASIVHHDRVETLAAQILAQAPPRFALAGLSMGGIVAMEMVRQAAERIERLCLMDTNPLAEQEQVKAQRELQIVRVKAGNLATVMRDEMKPNYLTDSANATAILDLCMDMACTLGAGVFVRQSRALQHRPDQCETLRRYTKPVLIAHGADDRLCPAKRHQLMHALMPQANYQIVEGAAHLPTLEQPDQTTALLRHWLE